MIESFRHKGLKRLFESDDRRLLAPDMVERIRIILAALDAANAVRANWRIVFRFDEDNAFDVDLVDYH